MTSNNSRQFQSLLVKFEKYGFTLMNPRPLIFPIEKYLLKCKNGHDYSGSGNYLTARFRDSKVPCPQCAHPADADTDQQARGRKIIEARGGTIIGNFYKNGLTRNYWINVQCEDKSHPIVARQLCNIVHGQWCMKCRPNALNLQYFKDLAVSRGGLCLAEEYIDIRQNMQWQCTNGHIWTATCANVKASSWCPHCVGNVGEEVCRAVFEEAFPGRKFINARAEMVESA